MAVPVPPTFVDLATAFSRPDVNVNVMGVVVDHLAATQSRGLDSVITFTLRDPCWSNGLGLKCRCFNKKIDNLPAIGANGDVVLLRNVKIKDGKGQMMALSNPATSCIVFPQESIPPDVETLGSGSVSVRSVAPSTCPSRPEAEYAIYLASTKDSSNVMRPAPATSLEVSNLMKAAGGHSVASSDRFSLIENLRLSERNYLFADLLAEIRRFYVTDNRVELSVTDYSGHPNLFNYVFGCDEDGVEGDKFGHIKDKYETWPGPWGQMTMLVTLWDTHATYARNNLRNGNFVFLRNVQISMGRDGNKMEGNIRGDRRYPDKVNVVKKLPRDAAADIDDPERIVDASKVCMRALLKRKREYEKKAEEQNKRFIKDASNLKRKAEVDMTDKSSNQNTKKKSKRQRRKAPEHANEPNVATTVDVQKPEVNVHVRCEKFEVPLKTVEEILDRDTLSRISPKGNDFCVPFQNCCYHSKIRVVDFFPDNIADFAVPHRPSDNEALSEFEDDEASDFDMPGATDVQWEWRFCLLVEDARAMVVKGKQRAQMQLLVAEGDGDYLLDMDASDLREDSAKLQRVQEKLFVLWGDLQEQKEAAGKSKNKVDVKPSSRPFECLIKEYGIPVRNKRHSKSEGAVDFERMFRVWGTCVNESTMNFVNLWQRRYLSALTQGRQSRLSLSCGVCFSRSSCFFDRNTHRKQAPSQIRHLTTPPLLQSTSPVVPRILLFGAGSVGAVYIHILEQAGAEVTAVCRSNYEAVRANGFTIKSNMFGTVKVKPQVVRSPSDASGAFDYVVICSKAMPGAKPTGAELIKPAVGPKTGIVILQNGIANEEEYANMFPENPIISGVVYLPATQISPGVVVHQEIKLLHLGSFPATAPAAHKASVAGFAALVKAGGGDIQVHENVQRERWSKLMVNAAWNPTCALTRSKDAEYLRSSPGAADVVQNIMLEVAGIAQAAGYKDIDATKVEKQINRAKVRPFPGVLPSMAQDILEGRAMEVEAILGNTIRIARNHHMSTPLLDLLYAFAKGLDAAGERSRQSRA